jgi:DNA-binding MarR family transcriptional regulator
MTSLGHPELVGLIMAAVDKIIHVEKGQVLEAEGIKLHPSEIHLLLFLHGRPGANASEIAERFNITKGAVSQTLSRLERKGVLTKDRNPESQTELVLNLTPKGDRVMVEALRVKEAAERKFDGHLMTLTEEERAAVGRFFRGFAGEA